MDESDKFNLTAVTVMFAKVVSAGHNGHRQQYDQAAVTRSLVPG